MKNEAKKPEYDFATRWLPIAAADICISFNPLRAKLFRGEINMNLYFVSFLHIDAMQVVEILPQIRQEPTYST